MKNIYIINSYISPDEDVVYSDILKLIELGNKNKKYVFVSIQTNTGYGTGLDDYGYSTELDAVLSAIQMLPTSSFDHSNELYHVRICDLEDALEIQSNHITALKDILSKKEKGS